METINELNKQITELTTKRDKMSDDKASQIYDSIQEFDTSKMVMPFNMICTGRKRCGKSYFIEKMIKQKRFDKIYTFTDQFYSSQELGLVSDLNTTVFHLHYNKFEEEINKLIEFQKERLKKKRIDLDNCHKEDTSAIMYACKKINYRDIQVLVYVDSYLLQNKKLQDTFVMSGHLCISFVIESRDYLGPHGPGKVLLCNSDYNVSFYDHNDNRDLLGYNEKISEVFRDLKNLDKITRNKLYVKITSPSYTACVIDTKKSVMAKEYSDYVFRLN